MRPDNLKTKIFLDGGDPAETKEILDLLGFLDGQTTNPSLFAKNPEVQEKIAQGEKYSKDEVYQAYQGIVTEVSELLPQGSVSIEVYADKDTPAGVMVEQAHKMNAWIANAHIKLPITQEGLKAAEQLVKESVRLNMTLAFSQSQAAAVYAATRGADKGQVYLSPFVGRLDDRGEDGMSYIKNVVELYKQGDGHVEILSASIRNLDHFLQTLKLGCDIATVPGKILRQWHEGGLLVPDNAWQYDKGDLKALNYEELDLEKDWQEFAIQHELTDKGLAKFAQDWNSLVAD